MKIFSKWLMAVVMASLILFPAARAEEKRPADKEPATEVEFLAKAISCDIAEVKLAERAMKQASNKDVQEFARKMKEDHTKHRDALLERAKVLKIGVVEGLEKEHQERMDRLSKLEGAEFDREYMRFMVEGHEKALRMYESWSKKSSDKELGELVNRTIPTVKEHLEQARQLHNKLKS